ncbi:uncharacterized protein LY89DRAFT_587507 [Mollisia scopiformis]|uniref:CorA-like transporter domain-containing protein n=1 Tax=Mollisia scopiformis TaxID=149040 RepID=A0A194X797_MOLSC|nr:uncharacterized protein LY89DRAFT_587507 [Mollisia scopiformis]KUJ15959.1 hypothetical protein LY89DRAFT_587507 [Mollisia scopiformis]
MEYTNSSADNLVESAFSEVYDDANKLRAAVDQKPQGKSRIRIISIYSERTIEPLQITSILTRKILHKYKVHPDFLRVLFSFGEEPHIAEASSNNLAIHSPRAGETLDITYQVNYVEENLRKGKDPWSFRHTGVYHHHTPDFDLFILLHPINNSVLEDRLLKMLEVDQSVKPKVSQIPAFCKDPYRLHLLVMSSFFDNWRWYFRNLGETFAAENNSAMVIKPETARAQESFARVKSLRNMNDFALFAKACCSSDLDLVEKLKGCDLTPLKDASSLESQKTILRGHVESSTVLEGRIRNAIDLVGYTLTLHNQLETAKVDNELRDMTKELRDVTEQLRNLQQDTVDDSTTVKIITYVSAIYLPGSFVASVYGTNFFVFDQNAYQITIAHDFWIFIATWLPLTFITGALYIAVLWFDARRKGKQFLWPWSLKPPRPLPGKIQ